VKKRVPGFPAQVESLELFDYLRGVVEIRLDRGPRAPQAFGDLRDRQPLGLTEVTRQRDSPAPLEHAVIRAGRSADRHSLEVLLGFGAFPPSTTGPWLAGCRSCAGGSTGSSRVFEQPSSTAAALAVSPAGAPA